MRQFVTALVAALLLPCASAARGLVTGSRSVEFSLAAVDLRGPSAEFRYASLARPRMEIGFSVSALYRQHEKEGYTIPVLQAGAAFDFSHILLCARRSTLALWADLHLLAGYESVNLGNTRFDDGAQLAGGSTFLWGGMAALRLEIPLSKRCALSLRARTRYLPPSNVTPARFETGIGLRVTL